MSGSWPTGERVARARTFSLDDEGWSEKDQPLETWTGSRAIGTSKYPKLDPQPRLIRTPRMASVVLGPMRTAWSWDERWQTWTPFLHFNHVCCEKLQTEVHRFAGFVRKRKRTQSASRARSTRARRPCTERLESFSSNPRSRFVALVNRVRDAHWYQPDDYADLWEVVKDPIERCESRNPLAAACRALQRSTNKACYKHRIFQVIVASAFDAEAAGKLDFRRHLGEFCEEHKLEKGAMLRARETGKCYLKIMDVCGIGSILVVPPETDLGNRVRARACSALGTCLKGVKGFSRHAILLEDTARRALETALTEFPHNGPLRRILDKTKTGGRAEVPTPSEADKETPSEADRRVDSVRVSPSPGQDEPAPNDIRDRANAEDTSGSSPAETDYAGAWASVMYSGMVMNTSELANEWDVYFSDRTST
ncbi:hypothetical protein M409DRAFT_61752 [Zasmidium cellare ATCC 36951]|uniref:Uncharacterized protein n=1 Tax=Zasmidium cellare ATCC 36951 TaxID=1080233 RepID=A0A6A6BY49_ZASCE|nr:uncharacterized protein M409DRAFT_61752 [Zasmidium cellare ATCC 36951]KAF2158336.1 hypothetical protein M409DRAFT_61752 [Zasmidium cellare ATCC 36951]